MKIAILDDYLDVALGLADWQQLGSDADIQVFQKPFSDTQETVSALREFGVIVAMRERTGFQRKFWSSCLNSNYLLPPV